MIIGGSGTTIHASCRDKHDRSMKPRAWIRTFTSESDLTHKQLDDLFAGRFPTSCADEGRPAAPSGHLFFDRKFSKTSVHRAASSLHESAVHHVLKATWRVIESRVPDHVKLFEIQTNAPDSQPAEFTTKVLDIMISYAPTAK
ncbi:hypothetical protein RJZ90_003523, partial [Blastomyces dermatitidis]